jgi:SAM-dependent methyltransferase
MAIDSAKAIRNSSLVFDLLRKYFQLYWLKPFDAVNDTANAIALLNFDWSKEPILEIGGGDGVFSFIMHGGEFSFSDDRYNQTDPSKAGDIYDIYKKDKAPNIKKKPVFQYNAGLDLKLSHLLKSRETMLYKKNNLISSKPEKLPFKNNIFNTVFLYTFHGLTDYKESLKEIKRIIRNDGTLLMIAVNKNIRDNFVCHKMSRFCEGKGWRRLSDYFSKLDGGRYNEIGGVFAKSLDEWKSLFSETGFQIEEVYSQVSPFLWRIYDTQTRPFLKAFIRANWLLEKLRLKGMVKALWIYLWFPVLALSYLIFAKPKKVDFGREPENMFLAIKGKAS